MGDSTVGVDAAFDDTDAFAAARRAIYSLRSTPFESPAFMLVTFPDRLMTDGLAGLEVEVEPVNGTFSTLVIVIDVLVVELAFPLSCGTGTGCWSTLFVGTLSGGDRSGVRPETILDSASGGVGLVMSREIGMPTSA